MARDGKRTYQFGDNKARRKKIAKKEEESGEMLAHQVYGGTTMDEIMRMVDANISRFSNFKANPNFQPPFSTEQVTIHAKLEISQPEDAHEKQADDLANAVSENDTSKSQNILNEKPADVQTKGEGGSLSTTPEFDQQLSATKGQGQSLDDATKGKLEQHTGTDLSDVKIHTGSTASTLSEGINAKAFTHGQDIYFKDGNYNPKSAEGEKLLSHEVAHTVQNQKHVGRKIQRQKDDDGKVYYSIKIPPGTTSVEGFHHYLELVIFGKVLNLTWTPSESAKATYADIQNHIGEVIRVSVSESLLKQYNVGKSEQTGTKESDKKYHDLKGEEKQEIIDEIDRRYYERTGIKPGTKIQAGDNTSAVIWNQIKNEVVNQNDTIKNLSPDVKAFLHIENGIKPIDFEKYAEVAELLSQFTTADFLDYKSKIDFESTDLNVLKNSLEAYLQRKKDLQAETENREQIKTKLYGLEELYKKYRYYTLIEGQAESYFNQPEDTVKVVQDLKNRLVESEQQTHDELLTGLQQNGFNSIEEFGQYISDYEKAFETETVHIAEEHLLRYKHELYEEEKRLNDAEYISKLFNALSGSGAKEHYAEADSKDDQANGIIRDLGGYASGDQELKSSLRQEASSQRAQAQSAIKSLDSKLVKEDQFDTEAFTEMSSAAEMQTYLLNYLHDKQTSIDETWEDIHAHPDHIYELDLLLAASTAAQQIEKDSIYDLIIQDKANKINGLKILKAVCFVIIGIVLTVVTFGAAAPYAIAAGIVSTGISLYGIYEAAEDYKRNNAANDVGLLTNDPSLIWVMLAVVGAAVDLAALNSAFKVAGPLAKMTSEFNATMDVAKLEKEIATLTELDVRLQQNILKQARIQAQQEKLLQGLAATRNLAMVTIPGLAQTGELVARAIFAVRKGLVSLDSFIAELKAAKIIGDTGLNPEELLLVKDAFTKAKAFAKDEKLVADIEKAIADKDLVKLKDILNDADINRLWPKNVPKTPVKDLAQIQNGCDAVARQIQKAIGGEFLDITPQKDKFLLGPVMGMKNDWFWHVAVLKNGKVYDRLTGSAGMLLEDYKLLFDYAKPPSDINFTPVAISTLK